MYIYIFIIIIIFPSFSILVNWLYLSLQILPFLSSIIFPIPMEEGSLMTVWCLAACWVKPQIVLIKLVEMLHFINNISIKQYLLLLNDLSNLLLYLLLKLRALSICEGFRIEHCYYNKEQLIQSPVVAVPVL